MFGLALVVLASCALRCLDAVTVASAGARLDDVVSNSYVQGKPGTNEIDISLVMEKFEFSPDPETTFSFYAMMYRDNKARITTHYGPTIRANPGDLITVKLTNEIIAPDDEDVDPHNSLQFAVATLTHGNGFKNPAATNLHFHGLHGSPGLLAYPKIINGTHAMLLPSSYTGGDNVYLHLPSRTDEDSTAATVTYTNEVPQDHMPGIAWYHPHKHGSTTIQASTAYGVYIIEDNHDAFLSNSENCQAFAKVLDNARTRVLAITMLRFTDIYSQYFTPYPTDDQLLKNATVFNQEQLVQFMDFPGYQTVSLASNNKYCCNKTDPYPAKYVNQDFTFINGAYQPVIEVKAGVYQRWQIVPMVSRAFFEISILKEDLETPAPCTMWLYAKDAHYMLRIPRVVPALLLASGSRAEIILECSGDNGSNYKLVAGMGKEYMGNASNIFCAAKEGPRCQQTEQVLATIKIIASTQTERDGQTTLHQEYCRPLRPPYATDLTDDNLKRYMDPRRVVKNTITYNGVIPKTCNINGQWFSFPPAEGDEIEMRLGTVVETVWNHLFPHPTHIHVNPFQIVALDEANNVPGTVFTDYYKVGDYHDTLQLLQMARGQQFGIKTRFQPGPYPGIAMVHCHVLPHEDTGCAKTVIWKCPGYDKAVQPRLCRNFTFQVPGTIDDEKYPPLSRSEMKSYY